MAPKIAIVYYSLYGHIAKLAAAEKEGIEAAGGKVDVYQVEETLPQDVLEKMHAPAQDKAVPFATPSTLENYDAFLIGIPTRFGNLPTQLKAFWDNSGKQWATGSFYGKYAGVFISTATSGGGQEATAIASISTFAHHGIIYVPFGSVRAVQDLTSLSEAHGGSPWGAGTFAGSDGSRQPSDLELRIARAQGEGFYETVAKAFP